MMTISLLAWTCLLYLPYAHYMGSFSYSNGDEPGEMSEGIFVGLVVASQFGLFIVANIASHHAGFCYEDDKQRTYIVLYNAALIVNLILDMSLTAYLAYHQMCGRGVRLADGRLLSDLEDLQSIVESYPMQKAIGNNLFKYCWPATFFVPFFAEPFAAQIGPYMVGTMFVRSNKKLTGENAMLTAFSTQCLWQPSLSWHQDTCSRLSVPSSSLTPTSTSMTTGVSCDAALASGLPAMLSAALPRSCSASLWPFWRQE